MRFEKGQSSNPGPAAEGVWRDPRNAVSLTGACAKRPCHGGRAAYAARSCAGGGIARPEHQICACAPTIVRQAGKAIKAVYLVFEHWQQHPRTCVQARALLLREASIGVDSSPL